MYRASENSRLEKNASFVIQSRGEGPTAGRQLVVVVDALFSFIWVGQDGLETAWISSSLNAYFAAAIKSR
jgi:hypothetical protein